MSNTNSERESRVDSADASITTPAEPRNTSLGKAMRLGAIGLVAAVISCLAIGKMQEVFQLPQELVALGIGGIPGPEAQRKIAAGNLLVLYKHSMLWMGTTGAIVGTLFGLALGMDRSSRFSIWSGIFGGMIIGGAISCSAGPLAVYMDQTLRKSLNPGELVVPEHKIMMMHSVTWLVVGLGIGTGCAVGTKLVHCLGSGMIAGIAGAFGGGIYPFVAGIAMPFADPSLGIPRGDFNKMLWLGLPCVLIGLVLGRRG